MTGATQSPPQPQEPKRIKRLRKLLVKEIPKFPNDKPTRDALMAMSLGHLLIHYCAWRLRFIRPTARAVTVDAAVMADSRYPQLQPAIDALLAKARNGDDLTPHLSLSATSKGYSPAASEPAPQAAPVDRWADKDFLLNVMGFHHLHLGTTLEPAGHAVRTDEVLFAQVSRDAFEAVAILDHTVFDASPNGAMTPERSRLWDLFTGRSSAGLPPGSVYMMPPIATSGHPLQITMYASQLARYIYDVEQRLDHNEFLIDMYKQAQVPMPNRSKIRMEMYGLDFVLRDVMTNGLWIVHKGWI